MFCRAISRICCGRRAADSNHSLMVYERTQMSPNAIRNTLLAGSTLLLAACATIPPPEYSSEHPANPNAESAPIEVASITLGSYRPASVSSKTEQVDQDKPASAHAGHGEHSQKQEQQKEEESGHDQH